MEKKQKIQLGIFGLILISIFFNWLQINLFGKDESISAMQIIKIASYWPFYLIPLSAIMGIYFTIKPNGTYVFIASLVCLLVAIEFFFMAIPMTNFGLESNEEFLKLFREGLSFGFYFFAVVSLIAVLFTYRGADFNKLINTKTEKSNADINTEKSESVYTKPSIPRVKFELSKKQKKVALFSVIGIGLAIGIYFLIPTNKELKVGNQIWYYKDLDVTSFRDGEVIPEAKSEEEYLKYANASKPAWCYVDFDAKNKMYGKLYNRYVLDQLLNKKKKIGEDGWEIPDMADFKELNNYLGQNNENRDIKTVALEKIKTTLKSKSGWVYLGWAGHSIPYSSDLISQRDISYWCFDNIDASWDVTKLVSPYLSRITYEESQIDDKNDPLNANDETCHAILIRLIKKEPLKPTAKRNAVETKQATNADTQKIKTDTPSSQSVDTNKSVTAVTSNTNTVAQQVEESFPFVGIINAEKANFFENPDSTTIRKGYVMKGQEVSIDKISGNFYFGTFTAPNGKATKGWLAKSAIIKK